VFAAASCKDDGMPPTTFVTPAAAPESILMSSKCMCDRLRLNLLVFFLLRDPESLAGENGSYISGAEGTSCLESKWHMCHNSSAFLMWLQIHMVSVQALHNYQLFTV